MIRYIKGTLEMIEEDPMPKEASTANAANSMARILPAVFCGNAFCSTYIGPPAGSPFWFLTRYLTHSVLSTSLVDSPMIPWVVIETER